MGISQNISKIVKLYKEQSGKSYDEFAEELGIAKSSLQDYINGTSNPRAGTIDYIADRLGVTPAVLVSGVSDDKMEMALLLTRQLSLMYKLKKKDRRRFAKLFMEMLELLDT